jgi:hypothetical protein
VFVFVFCLGTVVFVTVSPLFVMAFLFPARLVPAKELFNIICRFKKNKNIMYMV